MKFPLVLCDLDFECLFLVCTRQPPPDFLFHSTLFLDLLIVQLTFCTQLIEFEFKCWKFNTWKLTNMKMHRIKKICKSPSFCRNNSLSLALCTLNSSRMVLLSASIVDNFFCKSIVKLRIISSWHDWIVKTAGIHLLTNYSDTVLSWSSIHFFLVHSNSKTKIYHLKLHKCQAISN